MQSKDFFSTQPNLFAKKEHLSYINRKNQPQLLHMISFNIRKGNSNALKLP